MRRTAIAAPLTLALLAGACSAQGVAPQFYMWGEHTSTTAWDGDPQFARNLEDTPGDAATGAHTRVLSYTTVGFIPSGRFCISVQVFIMTCRASNIHSNPAILIDSIRTFG
jgi:hypothetical protein